MAEPTICGLWRWNKLRLHFDSERLLFCQIKKKNRFISIFFSHHFNLHLNFSRTKTECFPYDSRALFEEVQILLFPFLSSSKSEQQKRKGRKCPARVPGRPMARQLPRGDVWKKHIRSRSAPAAADGSVRRWTSAGRRPGMDWLVTSLPGNSIHLVSSCRRLLCRL